MKLSDSPHFAHCKGSYNCRLHGNTLWQVCWYTPLTRWVLVQMIGFISSWVTHSHLITLTYRQYSVIARFKSLQILHMKKAFRSHLKSSIHTISSSPTPNLPHGCLLPRIDCNSSRTSFSLSYKPFIWHAGTLQLLRHCWRGHVTLPHSCFIQVFTAVAWQQTRRGNATRFVMAQLSMEKTPLRLLLHNRGSVFLYYSSCMA
jgi:hypothetical protein